MTDDPEPFNRGAIKPIECFREGWQLIKEQYWLFVGITFVGSFIAGAGPMGILAGPMMCGMFYCVFQRMNNREVSFNMLFKGFDWFVNCLVPGLMMTGIALVLILGTYVIFLISMVIVASMLAPRPGAGGGPGAFLAVVFSMYGLFILIILTIVIGLRTLFFFAFPLVMDRGLSGWDAVKLSMRAARANLGGVIGVLLLLEAVSLASCILCCVGPILEMPLNLAMLAVAYRKVFPEQGMLARLGLRDDDDQHDDHYPPSSGGGDPSSTDVRDAESRNP